jgi:transcriptional regulator with XRE-family HTH domain
MNNYQKEMGARIRELREKNNWSLREAGEKLEMDYSYLGRIERGFIPSTKVIQKIAGFYNVDVSYILGEEMEIPKEMEYKVKQWYSVIQESEHRGYSPEDISKLLDTLDSITGKNRQNGDK